MVDDASHLGIGVGEKTGEHFHHARVETPLVGGERIPRRNPVRTIAQFRACRHEAGRELAREYVFAPCIPTLGELSAVGIDEFLRCLMW